MTSDGSLVLQTYAFYVEISVALTIWVARTLHRNGRRFLLDVFDRDEGLADSVNHLLVVGFYLINFGYILLALKLDNAVHDPQAAVESLASKLGLVTLVLGGMHFLNIIVFNVYRSSKIKDADRRALLARMEPPRRPS